MNTADYAHIPPDLKASAEWFLFKQSNGKPQLFSYRGKAIDTVNSRASGTFKEVCVESRRARYDGLAARVQGGEVKLFHESSTPEPAAPKIESNTAIAKAQHAPTSPSAPAPTAEDFADLPDQMVQARRWLVWKPIENKKNPRKKPSKVPFYVNGKPRSGVLDSPDDLANLATFDEALQALQTGQYAGLGFALGPDGTGNHWQGIDLDDVPSRPELQHLADSLPGYTEQSPSGKGMHAIGYGKPFATLSSNDTGIEAYSSDRYFTVTATGAGRHDPCDLTSFVLSQLQPAHSRGKPAASATEAEHVETVDPKTVTELRSALLSMPSDPRDLWVRMGHALKPLGNVGRGLWLEWSSMSEKFDAADAARTWDSFKPTSTDYRAVFAEAQRWGWINPLSNEATGGARSDFSGLSNASAYHGQENGLSGRSGPSVDLDSCVVDLDEVVSPDAIHPHVVQQLIPQGEVTLLAGHGAAGKSYIALLICIMVALGRTFDTLETGRTRVLFLSAEDDRAELQRRVAKICRALGVNQMELKGQLVLMDVSEVDPTLYSVSAKGEMTPTVLLDSVANYVQKHDIGLTVIDNASDVFNGNEILRAQVRAFIRTLRARLARPNRAVMLLAHVSKAAAHNKRSSGAATDEDYSGSTAWHNSVRSRLSLDTDDKGISTLKHLKANKGPKADPIRLEWHNGAPTVAGTYECPGAALADSLRKSAEKQQDEADKNLIVKIIWDFDRRGERLTTSMQGSVTVYKALSSVPEFPKTMNSERLNRLVRELERDGRIFRTKKYTEGRKWKDSFTCSREVVESAPNPATDLRANSVQPAEAVA